MNIAECGQNFRKRENNLIQSWIKSEDKWRSLIKDSEVCSGDVPRDVHLPWCLGFSESKLMCEKYQGTIIVITSPEIQKTLFDRLSEIANHSVECDYLRIWTGFSDTAVEGHFVSVYDGTWLNSLVNFEPFIIGQPNGDTIENCALADLAVYNKKPSLNAKTWYDTPCEWAVHTFCKIHKNPTFKIRGK